MILVFQNRPRHNSVLAEEGSLSGIGITVTGNHRARVMVSADKKKLHNALG